MTSTVNTRGSSNSNLHKARTAKKDEFYTRLEDIENELKHYRGHFKDKTVFLNCDDPEYSNFWFYFSRNFDFLGLKRLIATHYTGLGSDNPPPSYALELVRPADGSPTDIENPVRTDLEGDGDFRSDEAVEYLQQSDIVVTNPPFSLFREYVAQLMEYEKKFLIIGNTNAITYKEIWPYIQRDELWIGASTFNVGMYFEVPEGFEYGASYKFPREMDGKAVCRVSNICWYTNLDNPRRHEDIILFRHYEGNEEQYPKYDNYDAIEVNKVANIPVDYEGYMGVPITFLGKHNPDQFEIAGTSDNGLVPDFMKLSHHQRHNEPYVAGKKRYKRIFIKRVSE